MGREGGSNHRATCTSHLDRTIADISHPHNSHTPQTHYGPACMCLSSLARAFQAASWHIGSPDVGAYTCFPEMSPSSAGGRIRWMCSGHHLLHSPPDPRAFVPRTLPFLQSSWHGCSHFSQSFISVTDRSCLNVLLATVFPCLHHAMTNSQGGSCPWQAVRQVSVFSLALCLANRATRFCDGNAHSPMIGPYFCTMASITWDFRICVVFGSPSVVLVSVSELGVCTQLWKLRHLLTFTGFHHWTHGHIEGSVDVQIGQIHSLVPMGSVQHCSLLHSHSFSCRFVTNTCKSTHHTCIGSHLQPSHGCSTASARSLTSTTSLSPTSVQTT